MTTNTATRKPYAHLGNIEEQQQSTTVGSPTEPATNFKYIQSRTYTCVRSAPADAPPGASNRNGEKARVALHAQEEAEAPRARAGWQACTEQTAGANAGSRIPGIEAASSVHRIPNLRIPGTT